MCLLSFVSLIMKSSTLFFFNGTVVLPDRLVPGGTIFVKDGRIERVQGDGPRPEVEDLLLIDAQGGYIAPGYVDIHVHGGGGADFMDGTPEAIRTAARAHLRHGTTSLYPTTTTGTPEQIKAMFRASEQVRKEDDTHSGARIAGIHLYGPYFAADKVGCHSLSGRRNPDPEEYLQLFDRDIVGIATCAAELPGATDFYREASNRGYLVTCGHSNASWSEMKRGFQAGLRHVDHFWCAMSSVSSLRSRFSPPMQASMEQFVLLNKEMSTEVIADGCHLSAELLAFARAMLGPDRLCLVTDSNRALDMPAGRYRFGPETDGEWFESDGRAGWQDGSLASSVKGMDTMVKNMVDLAGSPVEEAVKMASFTPARLTGEDAEIGSLQKGKRADILLLDADLNVCRVFIGGNQVASSQ